VNQQPTLSSNQETKTIGRVFNTPLIVEGHTWIPLSQVGAWLIMSWVAGRKRPHLKLRERLSTGALTMPVLLSSEWCHNLAHAYTANAIGKPMDGIKLLWGMPRCVYEDLNDPTVTPRQHIARSVGGPIFNLLLLIVAAIARFFTRPESTAREVADTAISTNAFLTTVSLLPIPGIDGGPILKWSLVERGCEIKKADQLVRKVDGLLGIILAFLSGTAFKRKKRFIGFLAGLLSMVSFGVFGGWIREDEIPF
jgi:Zn-dependent protease